MRVIGFNFTKISAERISDRVEKLQIHTNIDVSDIKETEANLLKIKDKILGVKFSYNIDYDPGFAKLDLKGNLVLAVESKLAKEIIKQWKEKQLPEDFREALFNIILKKSSLKALQLEEELNLPLHISLPSLKIQKSEEKQQ